MGFTNRVQPYCRLAIMAMQKMPTTSCTQRCVVGLVPSHSWTIVPICFSPAPTSHYRPDDGRGASRLHASRFSGAGKRMQRLRELSPRCKPQDLDLNQDRRVRTVSGTAVFLHRLSARAINQHSTRTADPKQLAE